MLRTLEDTGMIDVDGRVSPTLHNRTKLHRFDSKHLQPIKAVVQAAVVTGRTCGS